MRTHACACAWMYVCVCVSGMYHDYHLQTLRNSRVERFFVNLHLNDVTSSTTLGYHDLNNLLLLQVLLCGYSMVCISSVVQLLRTLVVC